MTPKFRNYTVTFKTGEDHFSQPIPVNTISPDHALEQAKKAARDAYGDYFPFIHISTHPTK